ncbi:hypothetical protein JTE90_015342 [Oedothorax gibbosus]|uniref:Uncharacterized protein n=1 Tax=Oedothorax gibbosus TaxID=931172 RepID=A0AAV6U5N3_9ARAC|nr:hypothetical protein JTE90_015342 [Oedothorax gibbosus]
MESKEEVSKETVQSDDSREKPTDTECTSDRESSVESFHTNKSELSTTSESEQRPISDLIDIDDIELSDEESWLYKSPKKYHQL